MKEFGLTENIPTIYIKKRATLWYWLIEIINIYIKNRSSSRIDPRGTPQFKISAFGKISTDLKNFLLDRSDSNHLIGSYEIGSVWPSVLPSVFPSVLPYVRPFSWNCCIISFFVILTWCQKPMSSCAWQRRIFRKKICLPSKLGKWTKNGSKTGSFEFIQKLGYRFYWICFIMKIYSICCVWENFCFWDLGQNVHNDANMQNENKDHINTQKSFT